MRNVIIGAPRSGKSTLAEQIRESTGAAHWCADPISLVKEPLPGVTYLDDRYADPDRWSEASQYVCEHWLTMPGPWVIEGVSMARVIRKYLHLIQDDHHARRDFEPDHRHIPIDRIIVLHGTRPEVRPSKGQLAMGAGVFTVWDAIKHQFTAIIEDRYWSDGRQWGYGPDGEPTL